MYVKRSIAEGWGTPIVAFGVLLGVWAERGGAEPEAWTALPGVLVSTLILRRLAVVDALIRVRSWMPMSLFMLLMAMPAWFQSVGTWQVVMVAYVVSLYFLLGSYEEPHAEYRLLASGLALGVACVVYPSLFVLAIAYIVSMGVHLRVLRLRSLMGFLIGLFTPLWLWVVGCMACGQWDFLRAFRQEIVALEYVGRAWIPVGVGLVMLYWIVLYVTGAFHYVLTCFDDKIRTRMCIYVLVIQSAVLFMLLFLQADRYMEIGAMLSLTLAPIVGHFVVLSEGRGASVWCVVLLVMYAALTAVPMETLSPLMDGLFEIVLRGEVMLKS